MAAKENIIIDKHLNRLGKEPLTHYIAHVLCQAGKCDFNFNGEHFTLKAGETMIVVADYLEDKQVSADFQGVCIYISPEYVELCTPRSNYGIRGSLALFTNPIMQMNEKQYERLEYDFAQIENYLANNKHLFQEEVLQCAVKILFLNFFDIHASHNKETHISHQEADIMVRFIHLLEQGDYVTHRDIGHYADKLFITSKYLSEVSKKISGKNALYWINRFTTIHIRKLLQEKELSITEIANEFEFSSTAYFTRFVKKNLGVLPSNFYKP